MTVPGAEDAADMLRRSTRQLVVPTALLLVIFSASVIVWKLVYPSTRTPLDSLVEALMYTVPYSIMYGCLQLAMTQYEYVRVDRDGLVIAAPLHSRVIPWCRVSRVAIGSRPWGRFVEVQDGPVPRKLRLPTDHWLMPNPRFDEEANRILVRWEQHQTVAMPDLPPPPSWPPWPAGR